MNKHAFIKAANNTKTFEEFWSLVQQVGFKMFIEVLCSGKFSTWIDRRGYDLRFCGQSIMKVKNYNENFEKTGVIEYTDNDIMRHARFIKGLIIDGKRTYDEYQQKLAKIYFLKKHIVNFR